MSGDQEFRSLHDRTGVGLVHVNAKVIDERLPDIPDVVQAWATGDLHPNLFLYGALGTGKTWVGLWAAREVINAGECSGVAFWNEWRFTKDFDTLNWYKKVVQQARSDDAQWSEMLEFEKNYADFVAYPLMVIDDMWYDEYQSWYQTELRNIIKVRCLQDLTTIVISNRLPESDSPWTSMLAENFTVVSIDGER